MSFLSKQQRKHGPFPRTYSHIEGKVEVNERWPEIVKLRRNTSGQVTRPKRAAKFSKAREQECGEVYRAIPESMPDSSFIHFGFSIVAVQPVINVKGDELFAGKELIKKWSSRETAY